MATVTIGTNATTSLTAIKWGGNPIADIAAISNAIRSSNPNFTQSLNAYLDPAGLLHIPGRIGGTPLQVKPGDYVAIDSRGWPILISADTAANGPWTHT